MRSAHLLLVVAIALAPALAYAQQPPSPPPVDTTRADTARAGRAGGDTLRVSPELPGVRLRLKRDSLWIQRPSAMVPFGRLTDGRLPAPVVAASSAAALEAAVAARRSALWGQTLNETFAAAGAPRVPEAPAEVAQAAPVQSAPVPGGVVAGGVAQTSPPPGGAGADSAAAPERRSDIFSQYADLGLVMNARLETKVERNKNERCTAADVLVPTSNCQGSLQPQFDFQFNVRTGGIVADRVHVNVDYDSEREFDASNNISVYYEGKSDEMIHRLEVGNVSFAPPASRFITGGIPAGNYGLQATGQLGPMQFRTILAQQKGNVVKDRVFTVGDRTVQSVDRQIEDYQFERRRFFWVVDPTLLRGYPNVDILSRDLGSIAAQMDPAQRPVRVLVYRYRPPSALGSAAQQINGPYAHTRYARNANVIGPYEILQQGVDYYIDPSNLWIALVSPITRGERLAVSYLVAGTSGEEKNTAAGGTFPLARQAGVTDTVNLLWDSEILPTDAATNVFNREIRSVYRLGGEDIQRGTIRLKIVVGSGADQEKPTGATPFDTYLQMFRLAQNGNSSAFDVENRVWPRTGDPNIAQNAGGGSGKLIRDYFIVYPSLQPFADAGLVDPPNPVNDSLYRTPDEDVFSQRRPPTQYRMRVQYSAEGGGDAGTLALGSVQLRPGSERLVIDGVTLVRDVDYKVEYEMGTVTFLRPDTLFLRPRQVSVQYEENPLFAAAPTSIFGLAATFPLQNGQIDFTAISQSQKTTFNRPPLGFEPASALVAGVTGSFNWEAPLITRLLDGLPLLQTSSPSAVSVQGEFATSRPQPNAAGVAYVESFEGEGGFQLPLQEGAWRYGSRPPAIGSLARAPQLNGYQFDIDSAATLAWQNLGLALNARTREWFAPHTYPEEIDSAFVYAGGQSFRSPETLLWQYLYRSDVGGLFADSSGKPQWILPRHQGRRWRSLSMTLSTSGVDLSRVEQLEFWVQVDTSSQRRRANPTLVFDFGDISENTVAFVPESLTIQRRPGSATRIDSLFQGRRLEGYNRLDTERDPVTQSFDVLRNDTGLPGDVADSLVIFDVDAGARRVERNVPICRRGNGGVEVLGNHRANCTVGNRRLDEEDLVDNDRIVNLLTPDRERILRYVADLADPQYFTRTGICIDALGVAGGAICWVLVRLPFTSADDTINDPLVRRIRALRMTIISGAAAADTEYTRIPLARLKLVGSPWVKRGDEVASGLGGARPSPGTFVVTSVIGTQDNGYQSPPNVTDLPDSKQGALAAGAIQINEKSLRVVSTGRGGANPLPLHHRAEAFYRFPEGEKNFMGYQELRVWARGRNKGWGPEGDLQFFVKMGRDGDNFYMYRTPVNQGNGIDAWLPEVRVDFHRLYALRAQVQNTFLRSDTSVRESIECSGLDSALVARSERPTGPGTRLFAACDQGYIVYTTNPGINPPNLAAVQELAVGMLRVSEAGLGSGGMIVNSDSLELWVDDIRLTGVVDDPGYAGILSMNVVAGDVGNVAFSVTRRDQNFRQLGQQPSYSADNQFSMASSLRLEKFLPQGLGWSLPLSVSHVSSGTDPFFLSRSDVSASAIEGLRTPKTSATSYSLSARRTTPLRDPVLGLLLNNLTLSGSYAAASSRSEFQTGESRNMSATMDYTLIARPRGLRFPGWFDRAIGALPAFLRETEALRSLRGATFRWTPAQIRFASGYARNTDNRSSFTLPVELAPDAGVIDTGRRVSSLNSVWRNTSQLELRPFNALALRWDFVSNRDLRDYGPGAVIGNAPGGEQVDVGLVARGERDQLFGMDLGLERDRQMSTLISFAPPLTPWLKPRADLSTSYTMFRDPNSRNVLQTGIDSTGDYRLPRRLSNTQSINLGATLDPSRAIVMHTGDRSRLRRLGNMLQPIDVSWHRDLRSSYEGLPFTPGIDFQVPLGGIDDFRSLDDVLATSAGITRNLSANSRLILPLGTTLSGRFNQSRSTSWSRRLNTQTSLEAVNTVWPDLNFGWNYRPAFLSRIVSSIGANLGFTEQTTSSFQPTVEGSETEGLHTEQSARKYSVVPSIAWTWGGGLSTAGSFSVTERRELRVGGVTEGSQRDVSASMGRSFRLPDKWSVQNPLLRTSMTLTHSAQENAFVSDSTRKVTDNGRWMVTATGDADVAENLSFSMQLSRMVNFDNLNDRRFSQTVISAVLHLQFFAGELR